MQEQQSRASKILNTTMYQITDTLLRNQNFVYNQIESFNNFIKSDSGLRHIILKTFKIQNIIVIEDTEHEKDGQKYIAKCITLDVTFNNVDVRPFNTTQEEIDYFIQSNGELKKNKMIIQDTVIPNHARRTDKTLKVDVVSDIVVTLKMFANQEGAGDPIDESVVVLQEQIVSQLPLMVGSKYCMLNGKTKQQLIQLQEDPSDQGGYFIIKGKEWSVDSTESVKFNELSIQHFPKKHLVRGFIMSKPGDAFELSICLTIYYCEKSGRIYVNMEHERFKFVDIPFFFIFKIFGISNEMEMVKMITEDELYSKDPTALQLQKYIYDAMDNEYDMFPNAHALKSEADILAAITDVLNSDDIKRKHQELHFNYTQNRVKETFVGYLLPHMGTNALSSYNKMRFLGHLIRKMLVTHKSGSYPDQNAYIDKRIHSTGQNISKAFRKCYNYQVIKPIRMKMIKELQKSKSIRIDVKQIIIQILNQNYKNKALQKSITTGSGTELKKNKGNAVKNRMQSQQIVRKNLICTMAIMRLINNQKQSQDKQSKKILEQRSIQQAFCGYVCLVQSTETSEKAGKIKSLSSMTIITTATPSSETIATVHHIIPEYLYELDEFRNEEVANFSLIKVFVNGFWIGFIQKVHIAEAIRLLRQYRRQHPDVWGKTTIYENDEQELHIYTDYGRLLTPMIIVHKDENGNPYINITEDDLKHIIQGHATVDWLLKRQIIEYISIEESHNCLVAQSLEHFIEKFDKYKDQSIHNTPVSEVLRYLSTPFDISKEADPSQLYDYTHVFIPHSIFSLVGLLSPFSNHTQTQRITMFTNQARQACGWATFNFPYRIDKSLIFQYYVSSPSVRTIINDFFPANGQQIIVAYTSYDGSNQDDSVILNKGAIDRGLFNCVYYTFEEVQIKFNEFVEKITAVQPANHHGNYTKLVDGKIQVGVWVQKDDVLVAKKEQNRFGEPHNTSLLYKKDEPAYIEEVLEYFDDSSTKKIVIKMKCIRKLKQGDKMSSRSGCKAIVSKVLDTVDMPYTAEGIVPDLIFTPTSVPTRMIIGQIYESISARLCVETAESLDGTIFCNFDLDSVYARLEQHGVRNQGYVAMRNGSTGEQMITDIFLCPTFYQRLQKFAISGQYIIHDGPKDPVTRQPIEGRQSDGGMRMGEMEKDCIFSHGSLGIFTEKFMDHSDGCYLYYCRMCGRKARFNPNPKHNVYKCDFCDVTDIVRVPSAWIANVFTHSLNAMNIDMTMEFLPQTLEVNYEV